MAPSTIGSPRTPLTSRMARSSRTTSPERYRVEPADLLPKTGRSGADVAMTEVLGSALSRLKPAKRRFLMGVVRDLASEFDS